MQLDHTFTVPVAADAAWDALVDFERVAPCLPGASLKSVEGDVLHGAVKVKLGPVMLNYQGSATILEKDRAARQMVMDGRAKDARGNGTASAKITARLEEVSPTSTRVLVTTELAVTGRPAQFGRSMIQGVGNKVIGQFADRLAALLTNPEPVAPEPTEHTSAAPHDVAASPDVAASQEASTGGARPSADALDLGTMIGPGVRKAGVAVVAVLALLVVLWLWSR